MRRKVYLIRFRLDKLFEIGLYWPLRGGHLVQAKNRTTFLTAKRAKDAKDFAGPDKLAGNVKCQVPPNSTKPLRGMV